MANSLDQDLKDKIVVLKKEHFRGDVKDRLFLCEDGFGCSPVTRGTAIAGTFLSDGERTRVEGYDVARLATPEEAESINRADEPKS